MSNKKGTGSAATDFTASNVSNPALHQNMIQSELYTNAGFLALNIWDRFDIFCTLGTTNAYIKGSSNAFNLVGLIGATDNAGTITSITGIEKAFPNASVGNAFVELYTDSEFAWSIGARGALWECGCATLGAEFQYAQAKPDVSQINVVSNVAQFSIDHPKGFTGENAKLPLPTKAANSIVLDLSKTKQVSLNYSEWQVGLALAYRLNFISPYIGIKWAKTKFDFDSAYIAQPQLKEKILDLLTWNPTLAGIGSLDATKIQDLLTKVSVTLNKLKSRRLWFILRAFLQEKLSYTLKKPSRAGFFGDYVFNRFLKTNVPPTFQGMSAEVGDGSNSAGAATQAVMRSNIALHKNMMQSELYTNAGFLALNIWDRFDIFCTLGTTNTYIKGSSAAFNLIGLIGVVSTPETTLPNANISNAFVELYTDSEFSWSVGAKGALWECGCATLGAEFQYAQAKPDISQINVVSNVAQFSIDHPKGFVGDLAKLPLPNTGNTTKSPDLAKAKQVSLNYSEWQVGLALAYRLNFISPYIGIKWSKAKFDFDGAFITQPQLDDNKSKLKLVTWNPTLAGTETAAANVDVLTQVSVTLNKLKSRRLWFILRAFLQEKLSYTPKKPFTHGLLRRLRLQ